MCVCISSLFFITRFIKHKLSCLGYFPSVIVFCHLKFLSSLFLYPMFFRQINPGKANKDKTSQHWMSYALLPEQWSLQLHQDCSRLLILYSPNLWDTVELVLLSRVLLVIFIYGLLSPLLLNVLSTWGFTSVLLWHRAVLNHCGCDIPVTQFFTPRRWQTSFCNESLVLMNEPISQGKQEVLQGLGCGLQLGRAFLSESAWRNLTFAFWESSTAWSSTGRREGINFRAVK